MEMLIIVVIVCIIIYFICKNNKEETVQEVTEIPDGTFCEINDVMNTIVKFRKEFALLSDEAHTVYIIQTDSSRIRYSKEKREHLQIKFYIYEDFDNGKWSKILNKIKSEYFKEFELRKENDGIFYFEFFTHWPYVYGEKTLIPNLVKELNLKYPEYVWQGSTDMVFVNLNDTKE